MQFGPYEVIASIGAGGMGEVFRARDPRLGRDVAIKVLPASFASDSERLRRFEREARAVAALNHPNILAIHDIGTREGAPFIVSELLEGESLRQRLSGGALPVRKAIEYAVQMAQGLAAAHEKGIVHRDLKPENVFVTRDGRVKILDFGLAKLTQPEGEGGETMSHHTEAGVVLGTVGYMSPEQVRGKPTDHRSDVFSFGAILYEMLSGRRAFQGETAADTMSAILREEPPDLTETNRGIAPGLERIVGHCLEKNPEERFQSAHDIAFDLQLLSGQTPSAVGLTALTESTTRKWLRPAVLALAFVAAVTAAYFAGVRNRPATSPRFQQLTFQRGPVSSAAFAPDGQTVIYSAAWNAQQPELYSTRIGDLLSRPLELKRSDVTSISKTGELALVRDWVSVTGWAGKGMLARMAISGGAPRDVLDGVNSADWSPDGTALAVTRHTGSGYRLEYPIGTVQYETAGWLGDARVSPDGQQVAFVDHPTLGDTRGSVRLVGADKKARMLSADWSDVFGAAWSADGKEVWFSASNTGISRALYAVTTAGTLRTLLRVPGSITLHHIARDGRVLLSNDNTRRGTMVHRPDEAAERDLAWFDWTLIRYLSNDGQWVLFDEEGEGGGHDYTVYLRKTDGSPAIRMGPGAAVALSPDAKWALAEDVNTRQFVLYPTGAGEQRQLTNDRLQHGAGRWTPDGKWIVFTAREPEKKVRTWVMPADGGAARPVTPEGVAGSGVTPNGEKVLARDADKWFLYPLSGNDPATPVPQLKPDDAVLSWAADGHSLFVREAGGLSGVARVVKLDLNSGRRELFKDFAPSDRTGLLGVGPIHVTPDGKTYVYGFTRRLSDLYVVEGLK